MKPSEQKFPLPDSPVESARALRADAWLPLLRDTLARRGRFTFPLRGNSMRPTLPAECDIEIVPSAGVPRLGELLVFVVDDTLVAHRLVRRRGETLYAQGDNRRGPDRPLRRSQVLGRVRAAYLGGQQVWAATRRGLARAAMAGALSRAPRCPVRWTAAASMTNTASLTIGVGGVVVTITTPLDEWRSVLADRYAAFTSTEQPTWRLAVRPDSAQPFEERGWAQHDSTVTRFHIFWYQGEIDLGAHTSWVTAPSLERLPSALERTLTYILMQALPRQADALLLHACGVTIGGRGYAFFGPSGAGKTTVAALARDYGDVLGDENVVLRLTPHGVDLMSTPFWGSSTPASMICRANRTAPLAGLYSLAHAGEFTLSCLTPGEGIAALLETEKVATERVESAAAWLTVAGQVVERVPCNLLGFPPTAELWPFLLRHDGGASAGDVPGT